MLMFMVVCARELIDMVEIEKFSFSFELGIPFNPFQQLMAVLPPASKVLVPECFRVSIRG